MWKKQKNKQKARSFRKLRAFLISLHLADDVQHFAVLSHGILQVLHKIGLHIKYLQK